MFTEEVDNRWFAALPPSDTDVDTSVDAEDEEEAVEQDAVDDDDEDEEVEDIEDEDDTVAGE